MRLTHSFFQRCCSLNALITRRQALRKAGLELGLRGIVDKAHKFTKGTYGLESDFRDLRKS